MTEPTRILLALPNWVGDVVMATPALRSLRRRFSRAQFGLMGRAVCLEVLRPGTWVSEWILDRSAAGGGGGELLRTAGAIRAGHFDMAVLLPNSFRSALAVRLGGVKNIVGYARDGRGWLLRQSLEAPRGADGGFAPTPAKDYYMELAALLGGQDDDAGMELELDEAAVAAAQAMLVGAGYDPARQLVMLNPGAAFGVSKLWDPHKYAAVADALAASAGAQIVVNAAPSERDVAAEVVSAMAGCPLLDFSKADNTIALLKALLARADLLITNDTGARHVGAAMGAAVVTIFGSTDPAWTVIDYDRERIIRVQTDCGPCQQKLCTQPPGPRYHQCMAAIEPAIVIEAAEQLLAVGRRKILVPA